MVRLTVAELRPVRGDILSADALATLLGSKRTAQRCIERWHGLQSRDPNVPRVLRLTTGRRGRPAHVVDRDSFEAWRRRWAVTPRAEASTAP